LAAPPLHGVLLRARSGNRERLRGSAFWRVRRRLLLLALLDSFRQGLGVLGWVEGSNISIEYQFGDGALDQLAELAAALVRLDVDVIVTVDTPPTLAAKRATGTIPIVIAASADPVAAGLVASLAHPDGNVTGLSLLAPDTDQKKPSSRKRCCPKQGASP
jgi:putative tryptophan/tyrosine transport system substrate-binding protein